MKKNYTDEGNALIIVALLKKHGIKQIIASPGTTNVAFVRSVQIDPFFKVYSSVDERSAAYMACGLASESGEAVVISCTGATASRNYLPGLTEAFYRKLPVLAITSTRDISKYGHHEDQVIDRSVIPKDVAKLSVHLPSVKDTNDMWECRIKSNNAILELYRNGGGPVHINLTTTYDRNFSEKELPDVGLINRITVNDNFPNIQKGKVAIFVGSHQLLSKEENRIIDKFCESTNSVVLCDHTSGYKGEYGVKYLLPLSQSEMSNANLMPDTLIHIGEISGFYSLFVGKPKEVWRVNKDGEIRDTFNKLRYVFEMSEFYFFENYINEEEKNISYYSAWQNVIENLDSKIPELPYSNLWIAKTLSSDMPENSNIHFGILNSLSSWNYFDVSSTINCNSNVGGFGIDGCMSSLLGASLFNKNKIYFGVIGDLAFFYDLNSIGNKHLSNNLRILVVNNGKGMEFKLKNNPAVQFGDETDDFIAAAGHFGNKSPTLIKDYSTSLGFKYISASNKEEFNEVYHEFISTEMYNQPILFEVFTSDEEEDLAQKQIMQIGKSFKGSTKKFVKNTLGDRYINKVKNLIN